MLRGTRIAKALIEARVDGSKVNDDIVDAVEEAGPGVERAGKDQGEGYGEGFSDGFLDRMRARLPGIRERIGQRIGGKDIGAQAGDEAGESFVERMGEKVKDLGGRVAQELSDRIASNPEQVRRGIDRAFDDDFADRVGTRLGDRIAEAMGERVERAMAGSTALLEELLEAKVSGNRQRQPSLGDRIGGILGAGSRNNVLNLFGRSLGNIIDLAEKARSGITGMFRTFIEGGSQATGPISALRGGFAAVASGGGGLSKMFSSLASSGPAAAVAITVVVVALSALASIIGALVGLVTALAAAITGALAGALAIVGAGILAVVSAAGLLTAAFMSMDDAQKNLLKTAFVPLRQEMIGIGQLMIQEMVPAFQTWSTNLQNALMLAVPLATVLGRAFAEAGNDITAAFSGPGFQRFAAVLGSELPTIINQLANALGGFLNGALGLFSAILPYVTQFSVYLNQVAQRFATWANSAQGQNAIVEFMDRAVESVKSVWSFVEQFVGFLGDVLFNPDSMGAGNSIFDSLADTFEDFRAAFARAAADGSLKQWFDDAIQFGSSLYDVIVSLYETFVAFYNSGMVQFLADAFNFWADSLSVSAQGVGFLVEALGFIFAPLRLVASLATDASNALNTMFSIANSAKGFLNDVLPGSPFSTGQPGQKVPGTGLPSAGGAAAAAAAGGVNGPGVKLPTLPDLKNLGSTALAGTATKAAQKAAKKFKNPYLAFANQILADAPGVASSIKNALLDINEQVAKAISDASSATSGDSVTSALTNLADSIVSSAEQTVNSAQQALFSAAQSLASASSMKAANKALREVKRAQKGVNKAMADQARIQAVADMLAAQSVQSESNILALVSGNLRVNATLADVAEARARIADQIADANQKLAEAIQIRDQYQEQIADSIRSFGSLLSAQAKTINGVQQALSSNDIVTNLQDRLAKIKQFQENLRLLLAQGISQDVYRQLVEAGVDGGSAYAEALLAGGPGAINTVNQLVSDINSTADTIGDQASTRLYQAGVDSATALLDGLKAIESSLITYGETLGASIAAAIQRGLGTTPVAAPPASSTGSGGGGGGGGGISGGISVGQGLGKVAGRTAAATAAPEMPPITVVTPTEDPYAVAQEVWNEFAGRLM